MRQLAVYIICAGLFVTACNQSTQKSDTAAATAEAPKPAEAPKSKLDEAGTQKLMTLVTHYYELKNALVATNATAADQASTKLITDADSLQAAIKTDSANNRLYQQHLDAIRQGSKDILALKDETCEKKRVHFEKVSDAMFALLKNADLKNAGVYRQFCPMAFNDKGAYWLSNEMEIKNPYFGKKMLECGEITDSLK